MHAKWPKGQFLKAPELQPLLALWLRFCCDDTIPAGCSEPRDTLAAPLHPTELGSSSQASPPPVRADGDCQV